ncbi:hypothetical protein RFI_35035 [Reticulomyxa filosa]|uniref:Uncharacterized protein n=1 Tax=Reticulomyxa filosa TaxID=46433 RepID=X6LNX2_RETFI|nr:hypothetical protein RFI_35035 [Reticulomyxa filosa]|eukprot:ETO02400.1 hypothetical protein RFI_35035 [Reticulomyxa filosa]
MSKEEDKFIEAAEDKETEKEDDSASASAGCHNDIEEESVWELIWKQQQREEMEADTDKLIAKKKNPWKTETPKIIKKGETHEIWHSRQLTDKQPKRLESLKAQQQQQQRSKTSQLKRVHVMLNSCKSLRIYGTCYYHGVTKTCATCSVVSMRSADAKSQIRRGRSCDCKKKKKRACYVKKKTRSFFLHDNSNSDIVSSNLRHADYVFTALSILDRFAVLIFSSSKSVRVAMYFDSSTIVQPFYQGSILLGKDSWFFFCFFFFKKKRRLHTHIHICTNI